MWISESNSDFLSKYKYNSHNSTNVILLSVLVLNTNSVAPTPIKLRRGMKYILKPVFASDNLRLIPNNLEVVDKWIIFVS